MFYVLYLSLNIKKIKILNIKRFTSDLFFHNTINNRIVIIEDIFIFRNLNI